MCAAEGIGTYFLVLTVGLNVVQVCMCVRACVCVFVCRPQRCAGAIFIIFLSFFSIFIFRHAYTHTHTHTHTHTQGGDNAAAVLSIAASLMAMIYALGPVSGAHLNPAVTVAVSIRSPEFGVGNMASYMSAQFAGGVAAGLSYYVLSTFKVIGRGRGRERERERERWIELLCPLCIQGNRERERERESVCVCGVD